MMEFIRLTNVERLLEWRAEVLSHVFGAEPSCEIMEANRRYFAEHLADGSHTAFLALCDGEEAGCGAACYYSEMPSPDNVTGRCCYLMNIYVRKQFRHKGIASAMVKLLIREARSQGCGKIYLETTVMGRSVYTALGFEDMEGYMKLP